MMGAHCPPVASGQEKYPLYQFGLGALKWLHSLEDPLEQGLPLSTSSAVLSNQPDLVAFIYMAPHCNEYTYGEAPQSKLPVCLSPSRFLWPPLIHDQLTVSL